MIQFTIVGLGYKVASRRFHISTTEMVYYASFFQLALYHLKFYVTKKRVDFQQVPRELQLTFFVRLLTGYLTDVLLFMSQTLTSYGKAFAIFFTNTLMIPVFARCLINEKLIVWDLVGIAIGFAGMLLTVLPYQDFQALKEGRTILDTTGSGAALSMKDEIAGAVLAFTAAVTASLSLVYNRKLAQVLGADLIGYWYAISNIVFSGIISFAYRRSEVPDYNW